MGLQITKSKARYIKDHDLEADNSSEIPHIYESRNNACRKFIDHIRSLEISGGWVNIKQLEFMPKERKGEIPRRGSRPSQIKKNKDRSSIAHGNSRHSIQTSQSIL
jgi:hypothetical protein